MAERVLQLLGPSAGGIRRHVATLAGALRERGWDPVVAGPAGVMSGLGPQDAVVPVPARTAPAGVVRSRRALLPLAAAATLVHAHGLKAGFIASTVRRPGPLVVTVHNLVIDESAGRAAGPLRLLEARLPRRADRVIAVSQEVADRFAGLPGADRVSVIAPAADPPAVRRPRAEVRAGLGVAPDAPLVVCVARLHPQKDVPTFLRAIDALRARVPGLRAALVGDGPERAAVEGLVDALGLGDVVVLAGRSPNAADEMAAADAVALSSRWEGNPITLAEAMQLGVPVAATAVGAVPDLVEDGATGRLVAPGDPAALAAACEALLRDRAGAATMAEAGRARAATLLGRDALVAAVEDVYLEVLGS
ncbi:MAG TPA: glycosyltransferase family 4 protein [Acidimicrobiales bacterium]